MQDMTTSTVIQLSPEELTALIDRAVETAFARHADSALTRDELARHFHVTPHTIDNWIREYKITPVTPPGKHKKYSLRQIVQHRQ